jgi:hypothetical protein
MAKGILLVETRPGSVQDSEYNRWYDEVHIPQILTVAGFTAARRFAPVEGDGPYVAIYEIEGDDLNAVRAALGASDRVDPAPDGMLRREPPPSLRVLELVADHAAD